MAESRISKIRLEKSIDEYSGNENVEITAKFAVEGGIRDAFNEANWTQAYNANDVAFKMKYGIKITTGGFRKKELGRTINTYRKASIFWTRNPKLVNPMKDRRIWVQVAKNFEPFIRLSEDETKQELFDFNERFVFQGIGSGPRRAQDRSRGVCVVAEAPLYGTRQHQEQIRRDRSYGCIMR